MPISAEYQYPSPRSCKCVGFFVVCLFGGGGGGGGVVLFVCLFVCLFLVCLFVCLFLGNISVWSVLDLEVRVLDI